MYGFVKKQLGTGRTIERGECTLPPLQYATRAFWLDVGVTAKRKVEEEGCDFEVRKSTERSGRYDMYEHTALAEETVENQNTPCVRQIRDSPTKKYRRGYFREHKYVIMVNLKLRLMIMWYASGIAPSASRSSLHPPLYDHVPMFRDLHTFLHPVLSTTFYRYAISSPDDLFFFQKGGVHAVGHALLAVVPLFLLCDAEDVDCEHARPQHSRPQPQRILVYDKRPGGVGVSDAMFGCHRYVGVFDSGTVRPALL